jgi:hypothetical protein
MKDIHHIAINGVPPKSSIAMPQAAKPSSGSQRFADLLGKMAAKHDPEGDTGKGTLSGTVAEPSRVSGPRLEQYRRELMKQINQIQGDVGSSGTLLPQLVESTSRSQMLRDAMRGVNRTPTGADLKQSFGRVESEWDRIEKLLKSDRELSDGELLGLQARLYQVNQHIEVMSKVVDQMVGGMKTVLNTNL